MKPIVKFSIGILLILAMANCTPPTTPGPCDSVGNNEVCLEGQIFTMNVMVWETWTIPSYKFYLDRENTMGASGPYIINQVILYNGGMSGIPEVGVYDMVYMPDTSSSSKQMIIGTYVEDGGTTNYYMDTTSVGTFEITSVSGTNISGAVNCRLTDTPWNMGGANTKTLRIKFTDVPQI